MAFCPMKGGQSWSAVRSHPLPKKTSITFAASDYRPGYPRIKTSSSHYASKKLAVGTLFSPVSQNEGTNSLATTQSNQPLPHLKRQTQTGYRVRAIK